MPPKEIKTMLCPICRKLISLDETKCPYCGTSRPGSWMHHNPLARLFADPAQLIKAIIILNVAMFALTVVMNVQVLNFSLNPLTFLSPDRRILVIFGATGKGPIDELHRWWSLLSANYLHGGLLHILLNMMVLRQIAMLVAREYGLYRMFTIYTMGGIIGFCFSYIGDTHVTIGASAAICSLIGAALYYGKSRGGSYGEAIFKQLGVWAITLLFLGWLVPVIDNWGHGGGIAAGILLGLLLGYQEKGRELPWHKHTALICAVCTLIVLAWAIMSSFYYLFIVKI